MNNRRALVHRTSTIDYQDIHDCNSIPFPQHVVDHHKCYDEGSLVLQKYSRRSLIWQILQDFVGPGLLHTGKVQSAKIFLSVLLNCTDTTHQGLMTLRFSKAMAVLHYFCLWNQEQKQRSIYNTFATILLQPGTALCAVSLWFYWVVKTAIAVLVIHNWNN